MTPEKAEALTEEALTIINGRNVAQPSEERLAELQKELYTHINFAAKNGFKTEVIFKAAGLDITKEEAKALVAAERLNGWRIKYSKIGDRYFVRASWGSRDYSLVKYLSKFIAIIVAMYLLLLLASYFTQLFFR